MLTLPRLYKSTKTGKTQICDISYENDKYYTVFGQLGGKLQTNTTTCQATNIGRSNERNPAQQTEFEALAEHKKKIKLGYALTMETPSEVTLPAKVKIYQEQLNNIKFPCYDMVKLNGINGLYKLEKGVLNLYSRGGELYPSIPHQHTEILLLMKALNTDALNGELYIHGKHLQDISSLVKKSQKDSNLLEFHVFDAPNIKGNFKERHTILTESFNKVKDEIVKKRST